MTYWEAADILEHGSVHYGKILEAEDAKFRELPKKGPLYGTTPGPLIIDEFCGRY